MTRALNLIGLLLLVPHYATADCSKGTSIRQKLEIIDSVPIEYKCGEPNDKSTPHSIKTNLVTANLKDAKGNLFTAVMTANEATRLQKEPDFAFLKTNCCVELASTSCDSDGKPKDKRILEHKVTAACLKERFFTFEFVK